MTPPAKNKKPSGASKSKSRYIETIGRRKTATARVRVAKGDSRETHHVNGIHFNDYFPTEALQRVITDAFTVSEGQGYVVSAKVSGGGIHAQAEAIRHGIARALVEENEEYKTRLKRAGFLKRDPRVKERRKFGLKKARKAPQWSKR